MTEILLNAILNLFAIQAALYGDRDPARARELLDGYLRGHLRLSRPGIYLDLFEAAFELHRQSPPEALLEDAAQVAANLRPKLPRAEQYVFLMRFVEVARQAGEEQAMSSVAGAVAANLDISPQVVKNTALLCGEAFGPDGLPDDFLVASSQPPSDRPVCRTLVREGFQGLFKVLHLPEPGLFFIKVSQTSDITIDGVPLDGATFGQLPDGAVLADPKGVAIYQSEIADGFKDGRSKGAGLVFRGENIGFRYPGTDNGLHDFSFCQAGGRLIGVMGASGAGKSTLLGILNGQQRPDEGRVTVNGLDLHRQPESLEGVIGYVPQDDLLFEDLTVFENLYFSACLCMANLTPAQRTARVEEVLAELNQLEIRDLKVGTPLDKTISGGQRKRLNIALELIRQPSILFVDEPTSGLSSSDSENVMGLLKALADKGRLVVAVIHQPSSRIFKMFDTLWVLDQGGRPIYDGNPLEALVYFRRAAHRAGQQEYACPHCGSVNPEQLFEIIEEKAVNEQGLYTQERLISARQWHQRYLQGRKEDRALTDCAGLPTGQAERRLWRPGAWGQLWVFFVRNLKSRLANRMYLAINLIEPPLLAVLAALLCRGAWGGSYSFGNNPNLGIYFFMAVIVALFLGLSVSAEEINRDRKILVRERFLNLSWHSYVSAKTLYLALVSALQMAVFTLVANTILDIPDMYLVTWLVLFCCSLTSCVLGLNISASLKSAVTIYILIPLLLVPQIMLGGTVVPYDQLRTLNADRHETPLVADLMPSRWGFEALLVSQFTGNLYQRPIFEDDCLVRQSDFLTGRLISELRGLADYPFLGDSSPDRAEKQARALRILANELPRLSGLTGVAWPDGGQDLGQGAYTRAQQKRIKKFLGQAEEIIRQRRQSAYLRLEERESSLRRELGPRGLEQFKARYHNTGLAKQALNQQTLEDMRLGRGRLVQLTLPICQEPESSLGRAHFLAAEKRLGPWSVPTQWFNLGVLIFMALVLYLALNFAVLGRMMDTAEALLRRLGR